MNAATARATPTTHRDVAQPTARGLLTQSSLYGLFGIARRGVSLVLTPLYTHYLIPHDYGVLEILSLAAWFTTIIGACKVDAAFFRYYLDARDREVRRRILSTSLLLTVSLSTVALTVAVALFPFLRSSLPPDQHVPTDAFLVAIATTWLELMTVIPLAYCRATDRLKFIGFVSIGQALLCGILAPLGVVTFDFGYRAVLVANMIGSFFAASACLWVVYRERLVFTLESAPMLLRYGLPMLPATMFMYVMSSADRYFLARFQGLAEVGVYGVAAKFALVIQMLVMTPFGDMWAANQFKLYVAGMKSLYEKTALTYLAILFLAALALALFCEDFVALAFGPAYQNVTTIIPLLAFSIAIWGIVPTIDLGSLVAPNKTWIRSVATGTAAAANLIANVLLIPRYGVHGAALAAVVGFSTLVVVTGLLNRRLVNMRAPTDRLVLMVGVLALTMLAPSVTPPLTMAGRLLLRMACFVGYAVFLFRVVSPARPASVVLSSDA